MVAVVTVLSWWRRQGTMCELPANGADRHMNHQNLDDPYIYLAAPDDALHSIYPFHDFIPPYLFVSTTPAFQTQLENSNFTSMLHRL